LKPSQSPNPQACSRDPTTNKSAITTNSEFLTNRKRDRPVISLLLSWRYGYTLHRRRLSLADQLVERQPEILDSRDAGHDAVHLHSRWALKLTDHQSWGAGNVQGPPLLYVSSNVLGRFAHAREEGRRLDANSIGVSFWRHVSNRADVGEKAIVEGSEFALFRSAVRSLGGPHCSAMNVYKRVLSESD
jgi:hypothetical protein